MVSLTDRYRAGRTGRGRGLVLALVFEGLLILVVLTLGSSITQEKREIVPLTTVAFTKAQQKAPDEQEAKAPVIRQAEKPAQREVAEEREVYTPTPETPKQPPPPPLISISPKDMASSNIANLPQAPGPPAPAKRSAMGPVDTGGAAAYADTPRVGTAPNGQPMYAAAWYREPSHDELAGYLSTADGPGWGLVACKTAPDWHVEDCEALDESPPGSRIARAVVAAAWQFQVRPPRVNGEYKVGTWVRIRIDYGIRRSRGYGP